MYLILLSMLFIAEQCMTVKTGFKRVLTYQSKLCHVKSREKTNYEAVYYRQTYLMNMLSDIKTET
jgi:hypothetical protein